jgi:hypothetical protein
LLGTRPFAPPLSLRPSLPLAVCLSRLWWEEGRYATVWTIKRRTVLPSKRGISCEGSEREARGGGGERVTWLCMKMTPHMKAVNQREVYLLG